MGNAIKFTTKVQHFCMLSYRFVAEIVALVGAANDNVPFSKVQNLDYLSYFKNTVFSSFCNIFSVSTVH